MPSRRTTPAKPWTEDERAWARECLDAGDTVAEVADWADRTPADVRGALGLNPASARGAGAEKAAAARAGRLARLDRIVRQLRGGVQQAEVARETGVSRAYVSQIAKREGLGRC